MNKNLILFLGILSLTFLFSRELSAQNRSISGKVTLATDGSTLPGVSILVKGTNIGTTTDLEGNYTLQVPSGSNVLIFSFVGLETQEITVGSGRSVVNVIMEEGQTE